MVNGTGGTPQSGPVTLVVTAVGTFAFLFTLVFLALAFFVWRPFHYFIAGAYGIAFIVSFTLTQYDRRNWVFMHGSHEGFAFDFGVAVSMTIAVGSLFTGMGMKFVYSLLLGLCVIGIVGISARCLRSFLVGENKFIPIIPFVPTVVWIVLTPYVHHLPLHHLGYYIGAVLLLTAITLLSMLFGFNALELATHKDPVDRVASGMAMLSVLGVVGGAITIYMIFYDMPHKYVGIIGMSVILVIMLVGAFLTIMKVGKRVQEQRANDFRYRTYDPSDLRVNVPKAPHAPPSIPQHKRPRKKKVVR